MWEVYGGTCVRTLRLLHPDHTHHQCDAGDVLLRYLERRVTGVVADGPDVSFPLGWEQPLAEDALRCGGDNVAAVPLDEVALFNYCTGDHISGVVFGIHGGSADFEHEVDVEEAEEYHAGSPR